MADRNFARERLTEPIFRPVKPTPTPVDETGSDALNLEPNPARLSSETTPKGA
jgi:hypothetical protein